MHTAPCGMFDVLKSTRRLHLHCSNFSLDTAIFAKQVNFKVEILSFNGCTKSQNLARLHEITNINTCKIVAIPKSQNFVLANNSNNTEILCCVSYALA